MRDFAWNVRPKYFLKDSVTPSSQLRTASTILLFSKIAFFKVVSASIQFRQENPHLVHSVKLWIELILKWSESIL